MFFYRFRFPLHHWGYLDDHAVPRLRHAMTRRRRADPHLRRKLLFVYFHPAADRYFHELRSFKRDPYPPLPSGQTDLRRAHWLG